MSRSLRPQRPLIAPSMLKCDFGNLEDQIRRLEDAGVQSLQLDVMDGHFVPNLSYGPMVIERVRERTDLILDAHLMISNPEKFLDDYLNAGCDWITVHIEALPQPEELLGRIRGAGRLAGIAINPKTPVAEIKHLQGLVDLVLIMSVEPGFGGQSFIPDSIQKVKSARQAFSPDTMISIDGGIGPDTLPQAARAGAEVFVAGSSIFDRDSYADAFREMLEMARSNSIPQS